PNLAAASLTMGLLGAAWIPLWFFLNRYLQQVLGYGAFASGAALLPITVTVLVMMVGLVGRLIPRVGAKPMMITGLTVLAGGIALFARTPIGGSFTTDVLAASLLAGIGISLTYIPALVTALAGAKPEEAGLTSGLVSTSYQAGGEAGFLGLGAGEGGNGVLTPSGNAVLQDKGVTIGTQALNGSGIAVFNFRGLAIGAHSFVAI